jgi:hypothetical protein
VSALPLLPVDPLPEVVGQPCETKVILSGQSAVAGLVNVPTTPDPVLPEVVGQVNGVP